jgi:hypothetical protein
VIDRSEFARKQLELTAEFGKFVFAHPEMDDRIPDGAFVFFEIDGEPEFNNYSRELANRQKYEETPLVLVRAKGLVPPQGSRLIDPVIEPLAAAS